MPVALLPMHPIDGELRIELVGDLARLIGFASDPTIRKPGLGINPGSTEWLVAGRGFEPLTFRL